MAKVAMPTWGVKETVALLMLLAILTAVVMYRVGRQKRTVTHTHGTYTVVEIYDVLTPLECDEVIKLAQVKGMEQSMVWGYATNQLDTSHRKSKQTWLKDEDGAVVVKMSTAAADLTKFPKEHQETLQVAMYEPNGKFNEHYDACVDPDPKSCEIMNHGSGERRATLLVYLNDDFGGGETEFVDMGVKIKPEKGKGILFWDTDDDEKIIPESKHRGNPVLNGHKWICTKWVHQRVWQDNLTDRP